MQYSGSDTACMYKVINVPSTDGVEWKSKVAESGNAQVKTRSINVLSYIPTLNKTYV